MDCTTAAETEEGLDKLLKILEDHCSENHIVINLKKNIKGMIFNENGRLMRRPFYLDGVKLEMVRDVSGEIYTVFKDL